MKETNTLSAGRETAPTSDQLDGTLLKCPGCRLKFPYSAENHLLEQKKFPPIGKSDGEPRVVLVTHCPQCEGWVTIA